MTVRAAVNKLQGVRIYYITPGICSSCDWGDEKLIVRIEHKEPGFSAPELIIMHNNDELAVRIAQTIEEIPNTGEDLNAVQLKPFFLRDDSDWSRCEYVPEGEFRYKMTLRFTNPEVSMMAANDLLELILDKLETEGLLSKRDYQVILTHQDRCSGHHDPEGRSC